MEMTSTLSTLSTAFAVTLRITEKIYDIIAVDQEAKDLLETTAQVTKQLAHARRLRRQKSGLMNNEEKLMVDQVFVSTEKAVNTVATLVEPARVDMNVSGGRVRTSTRMMFVFRDGAHIPVSLSKLSIANQGLSMTIGLLCNREGSKEAVSYTTASRSAGVAPPSYDESEWLYALRQQNLQRRASTIQMKRSQQVLPTLGDSINVAELDGEVAPSACEAEERHEDSRPIVPVAMPDPEHFRHRARDSAPIARPTGRARNRLWLEYQCDIR